MRLTRQTNYAFRALMYCASSNASLDKVSTIAKSYGISEIFLFKVLQPLTKAGLLESVRGRGGGIRLAKPADQITLLDIVRITEDGLVMAECFESDGADCPLVNHCVLNRALREALEAFMEVLMRYTIADLIANRTDLISLLNLPTMSEKEVEKV